MPTPKRKHYHIKFDDDAPDYAGIEVTMTGLSVGELLDTMSVPPIPESPRGGRQMTDAEARAMAAAMEQYQVRTRTVYEVFAEHLIEWNVDDDRGERVPTTRDGVFTQDEQFIRDVIRAWRTATQEVHTPLGPRSSGGAPSLELSLPTEPLSPNPLSSP